MKAWTCRVGWGDRVLIPVPGVREDARPFIGNNFQATLRDMEGKMREAASNLEFEGERRAHRARPNGRLRDEIKKLKLLDLEFANEILTGDGQDVDASAPKRWRKEAQADAQERFRKGRL